ncbi:MAG: zinc-dependent peptidase [Pseudomonadota bacterium]
MNEPATPARAALLLTGLAFAGAVLLHVDSAPLWCSVAALLALAWRAANLLRRFPLPGRVLRLCIVIVLAAATALSFRTLNGLAAGSTLLVAMGAAKLLESRARRDALIVCAVSMILLLAACLDRQALPRLPLYALEAWVCCAAFAALGGSAEAAAPRVALRTAGKALLFALPFALLGFLFFPRLPGPLWAMPSTERTMTGLGEEMSPGSISELTVSDAPAFRVRFAGSTPPAAERYWRGPVLHAFDGYTWRRRPGQLAPAPVWEPLGDPVRYRITLEPHGRGWWFALDTVVASPRRGVMLTFDSTLISLRPVDATVSYDALSYTRGRSEGSLSITARRMDTQLPPDRNPRSRALAQQMRAAAGDERAFVAAVLDYFRKGGFRYTLTPPLLDLDSIDDLLFNTRLGFCGHFASAYVNLMRAGGVPARVVTGYQGGQLNEVGGYYLIRQSDAHAWAEVWLDGEGWTRVDPTAVVAPERLTRGLRDLLPETGSLTGRFARASPFLRELLQVWDASNTWWREQVVEFDLTSQLSLLRRLGLPDGDFRVLAGLLGAGGALWLGFMMWRLRRRGTAGADLLGKEWAAFRTRLTRAGLPYYAHEGPLQLATRAGAEFPALAGQFEVVAGQYARLRYGRSETAELEQLRAGLHALTAPLRRRGAVQDLPAADASLQTELQRNLPLYRAMPESLRQRCAAVAAQFLKSVRFEGCNGLVVTDTMRQLIAFQAALLVVNRGMTLYRGLRAVLVYPDEFVVEQEHEDEAGVITRGSDVLAGQTVDTARVLISWADVEAGLQAAEGSDAGYNVVLHEFAHLLDAQVGGEAWHAQLEEEFALLCAAVDQGEVSFIDPYGAEDPAEFFAVCTEHFFEQPQEFAAAHPRLHALLVGFYGVDPVNWRIPHAP